MSRQQGFTLIELMVVLVIIGIASAAISLSIKPDPLQLLRKDAERVAQLAAGEGIRWVDRQRVLSGRAYSETLALPGHFKPASPSHKRIHGVFRSSFVQLRPPIRRSADNLPRHYRAIIGTNTLTMDGTKP